MGNFAFRGMDQVRFQVKQFCVFRILKKFTIKYKNWLDLPLLPMERVVDEEIQIRNQEMISLNIAFDFHLTMPDDSNCNILTETNFPAMCYICRVNGI